MKIWPWLLGFGLVGAGLLAIGAPSGSSYSGTDGGWRWRVKPYADGSDRWRFEVLVLYRGRCRVWIVDVKTPQDGIARGRGLGIDLGDDLDFTRPPPACTWEEAWSDDPLTGNWYERKD